MHQTESESPEEGFFNDLSQQGPDANNTNSHEPQNDAANKPKRIACILCRKRKLRCDGTRPTCATCKRLSHDCTYDEVRKKSGPKRGYVKLLEQRLRELACNGCWVALLTCPSRTSRDASKEPGLTRHEQRLTSPGHHFGICRAHHTAGTAEPRRLLNFLG